MGDPIEYCVCLIPNFHVLDACPDEPTDVADLFHPCPLCFEHPEPSGMSVCLGSLARKQGEGVDVQERDDAGFRNGVWKILLVSSRLVW